MNSKIADVSILLECSIRFLSTRMFFHDELAFSLNLNIISYSRNCYTFCDSQSSDTNVSLCLIATLYSAVSNRNFFVTKIDLKISDIYLEQSLNSLTDIIQRWAIKLQNFTFFRVIFLLKKQIILSLLTSYLYFQQIISSKMSIFH